MPKRLIIFADGTGNAFSTQESNVWRLYQGLDRSSAEQAACYIPGVGTSRIKPFALLDAATGIGVPGNVRKLYRFLCWNWSEDTEIYIFGFSRGSFTARTLVGLIHHEGLVSPTMNGSPMTTAQMRRFSRAAWRSYRAKTAPWTRTFPTIWITRLIRDAFLWVLGRLTRTPSYKAVSAGNRRNVAITFLGVFDTVEAYGVPLQELRLAIDWAIWPISFRNKVLSPIVSNARHALSLDDERTTFHPVLFDQSSERSDRIQQVWFSGVHSDIGGGYPDGTLAHIPLVWMATQAEAQGLKLKPGVVEQWRAIATPLGPLHDSRSGTAAFYRYDPRTVEARGVVNRPLVIHHSAFEKMVYACDNYAPVSLHTRAIVVSMPDDAGRLFREPGPSSPLASISPDSGLAPDQARAEAALTTLEREAARCDPSSREEHFEVVKDTVWLRKVAYQVMLAATVTLVTLPWTVDLLVGALNAAAASILTSVDSSVTQVIKPAEDQIVRFAPAWAAPWIALLIKRPVVTVCVVAMVAVLYGLSSHLGDLVHDRARLAWRRGSATQSVAPGSIGWPTRVARTVRTSAVARWLAFGYAKVASPALAACILTAAAWATAHWISIVVEAAR